MDLILARNARDIPRAIEIKSSQAPEPEAFGNLKAFKSEHPTAKLYCICQTTAAYTEHDVQVLPWKEGIQQVLGEELPSWIRRFFSTYILSWSKSLKWLIGSM